MVASFVCARCHHDRSNITDVRRTDEDHLYTRRRRECVNCGNRWTTFEIRREEYEHMQTLLERFFRIEALAAAELNDGEAKVKAIEQRTGQ